MSFLKEVYLFWKIYLIAVFFEQLIVLLLIILLENEYTD